MNNIGKKSEAALLSRLKQGEESAFEAIYWKYNAWIYNFIFSYLQDITLTEDLTQTVFLKIWEKRDWIDPEQNFESYIFTIARHLIYKEAENRLIHEQLISSLQKQLTLTEQSTEQQLDSRFLQEYMDRIIEEMPPVRKEIYKMSRNRQLTNREIAQTLSVSEKTVESHITKALQYLRKQFTSDNALGLILLALIVN